MIHGGQISKPGKILNCAHNSISHSIISLKVWMPLDFLSTRIVYMNYGKATHKKIFLSQSTEKVVMNIQ